MKKLATPPITQTPRMPKTRPLPSGILMCYPKYFSVEYVINPWMKVGSVDREKAQQQWQAIKDTYQKLGLEVFVIDQEQGLPDMVFAADQGFIRGKSIVMSNFRFQERRGETAEYEQWFIDHGYQIDYLDAQYYLEGGECLPWQNMYLVGTGFRAEKAACPAIANIMQVEVHPIELVDERFYHLDTCFFPLNDETAFYYPPAFTAESRQLLKKVVPDLQEFSEKSAFGFAANSVVIGDSVLMQVDNPEFKRQIENCGYKTIELDISEFMKSGGGIHCLTCQL